MRDMYILYGGKYTRSLMVEMVMAELGLEYDNRDVNIFEKEHRLPDYLKLNPAGWVPVLVTPQGDNLYETQAINLHLSEQHGIPLLAASLEDLSRGYFLSALFYIADEVEAAVKRIYFPHRYANGQEDAPAVRERAWVACRRAMEAIDNRLQETGPFHLGDRFSLPDIGLAYWAVSFEDKGLLKDLNRVQECVDRVRNRPAIRNHFEKLSGWIKEF